MSKREAGKQVVKWHGGQNKENAKLGIFPSLQFPVWVFTLKNENILRLLANNYLNSFNYTYIFAYYATLPIITIQLEILSRLPNPQNQSIIY